MAKLPSVVDETFESEVLKSQVPVLVDFSATWCGPCRALAPTLESLAQEYGGKMKFVTIDIDEARNTAVRFNIMSVPTMMIFRGGEVVSQVMGNRPKSEIVNMLDSALSTVDNARGN